MKKYIIYIVFLCCYNLCVSQNLVNNPSFEAIKFGGCTSPLSPIGISVSSDTFLNFQSVFYWNDAYYCNSNLSNWSGGSVVLTRNCGMVPNRQFGNPEPKDGNAYISIGIINNDRRTFDRRSYLQTIFKHPMQRGQYYKISFWARIPYKNDRYRNILAPNALAAYITVSRPVNCIDSAYGFINAQPQITLPENKYIDDTSKWLLVCGYYYAQGNERWLTIGNFYDSAHTKLKNVLVDSSQTEVDLLFSSCFVDLVSVEPVKPVILTNNKNIYLCDTINGKDTLYAQSGFLKYHWNTADTTPFLVVNKIGTYWVTVTDECGSFTDSAYVIYLPPQTLTVSNAVIKCADNKPIELQANSGFNKYLWSTGDTTPKINVLQSGNYWVNATYECGTLSDTVHVVVYPIPNPPIIQSKQYCLGDTAKQLTAIGNALKWYLQQNDTIGVNLAPIPSTSVLGSKDYFVTQSINNCESPKAKITISTITKPIFLLGKDTTICLGDTFSIGNSNQHYSYIWNDNDTENIKTIDKADTYILNAKNQCGIYSDTINIFTKYCSNCLQFPNAFTPNSDGVNDFFFPYSNCEIKDYHLQIFNRWGNRVFESFELTDKWNGIYNGTNLPQDSYVFICVFKERGVNKIIKGTILLLK